MTLERAWGPILSVEWLQAHFHDSNVRIVDARPAGEYAAAHLPGAVNMDTYALKLADSTEAELARYVESITAEIRRCGIRAGDRVIFYEGFSGTNAARGVWMLDLLGIGGGAMLDGGLQAWAEAGGALSRDTPAIEPSQTEMALDRSVLATADELLTPENLCVLDTRAAIEFMAGTIPTSIHIEWLEHLTPDGRFRSLEELRSLYESRGLLADGEATIATFCGSGYRAAHTYVVLKALGFSSVKNYAPSWGEWGRRSDLPVERPMRR